MARSDALILPRASFESTGPGESDSGLLSVVSKFVNPGDETQAENNHLGSNDVSSTVVQPEHNTVEEYCAPSLVERLMRNTLGSQIGTVTLKGPQIVQGQHANGVGEKMPKLPSHVEGMPSPIGGKASPIGGKANKKSRSRDSNWEDERKNDLLMGKLRWLSDRLQQALGGDQNVDHHGKSWSHQVAEQLSKSHKQCQRQWDTLLKSRNAICDHERKTEKGASGTVSFWDMTEPQKDTANQARRGARLEHLPLVFPRERYELMEFIIQIENGVKKIPSWKKSFQKSSGKAETSAPLDSGVTEFPVVGQVSDANTLSHDQEATINDALAITQGNCEGAEDRELKNDYDAGLVSMLVSKALEKALLPHISKLQGRREDKQKHQAKVIELKERKLELKEEKLKQFKRINSASSGPAGPSNMTFECLVDGQRVQAYDQMAPSGMNFSQLQNANSSLQHNTCVNYNGQATEVGQNSNFEPSAVHFSFENDYEFLGGLFCQPSSANTETIEGSLILSNPYRVAHEAGNQLQVSPINNSGCMQHNQLHADPNEDCSTFFVEV